MNQDEEKIKFVMDFLEVIEAAYMMAIKLDIPSIQAICSPIVTLKHATPEFQNKYFGKLVNDCMVFATKLLDEMGVPSEEEITRIKNPPKPDFRNSAFDLDTMPH